MKKSFLAFVCALVSTHAFAAPRSLVCDPVNGNAPAEVKFGEYGVIDEIRVAGNVVFSDRTTTLEQKQWAARESQVNGSDDMLVMKELSKLGGQAYNEAPVHTVTAPGSIGFNQTVSSAFSAANGVLFVRFLDANVGLLASALLLNSEQVFNNCK